MGRKSIKETIDLGYEVFFEFMEDSERIIHMKDIPVDTKLFYDVNPIESRRMSYTYVKYLMTLTKDTGFCEIYFCGKLKEKFEDGDFLRYWDFDGIESYKKHVKTIKSKKERDNKKDNIREYLKVLHREYLIYKEHGLDMGGSPITINDCDGNPYTVLNMELTLRC